MSMSFLLPARKARWPAGPAGRHWTARARLITDTGLGQTAKSVVFARPGLSTNRTGQAGLARRQPEPARLPSLVLSRRQMCQYLWFKTKDHAELDELDRA
ncbi:hypothetical protein PCASD_19470 [Puccinia coronata f. sp. avenae]|uniref:Uncharacterized protein n=1 Tax=Puccinia coronata f. sp. avenae TaxID=200324 RepID=A0A2N5TTZ4_9BASI|nr:hypothetical protein PCASD_19470 [Puccinia coronata f. sp. avenae]